MAIIHYFVEDLEKQGIDTKTLNNLVNGLGMSLEKLDKEEAVMDITPNRPDLLDVTGFIRAANLFNGKNIPKEKFYTIKNKTYTKIIVGKGVKRIRPFIAAAVIRNLDLSGNKLKYLINFTEKFCETYGRKRRKIAIGLHNLDVLEGALHYDAAKDKKITALGSHVASSFAEIITAHEKGIEYAETLSDSKVYPYLEDSKNVLSLIPIINSEVTRVKTSTKNLLVEVTGISQSAVEETLNLIACSFIDSGADVYPLEIVYKNKTVVTPNLSYKEIKIKRSKVENTLGVYLEDNKIINLSNKMGHVAAKYGSYTLTYIPPYRLDILNEQDIIEDIAIAYGYDKIKPIPILAFSNGTPEMGSEFLNKITKHMLGLGFTEAMNPYLTNESLNFDNMNRKKQVESTIKIAYAKTETITMLRTDLLPWLMQNLNNSIHEKMPQRLFEIGSVFYLDKEKVVESRNLGIVSEHSRANYSEIKAIILELLKFTECRDFSIKELNDDLFITGRAAKIYVKNQEVGFFGEISPKVLQNFKLEEPVVAAEISFDKL